MPATGLPAASRTAMSSAASPAASLAICPSTLQCSSSCAWARAASCSNCSPALYELCVSTPPKVGVAAFTMIPLTANTSPKKASSHSRTARPVSSRGFLSFDILRLRSRPEEVIAHLRHVAGIDVDQAEQDRGRGRRRVRAVVRHGDAHLARLVGTDIDELAPVRARREPDEINQRGRQPLDAEDEVAVLE